MIAWFTHVMRRALALRWAWPTYYGWWVVAAGAGALAVSSGISFWAFGLFFAPLEEEFGWTRSQVSGAVSVVWLVSGLMGPLVGWWVDRHGVRGAMLMGVLGNSATFFLLPWVKTLWHLYLLYGIGALFRAWMFYLPVQTLVSRWFRWRRGLAMSIANAGFGVGGFIFTPLITFLIERWGWRQAFFISGIVQLAYFLPVVLLVIKESPQSMGVEEPQVATVWSRGESPDKNDYTLAEAVRTPAFWCIVGAMFLSYMSMLSFLVHAVPFFRWRGISAEGAAAIMSANTGLYTTLRISMGWVGDRIPPLRLALAATLLQMIAVTLALISTSVPMLVVFVPMWASAQGAGPLLEPLLLSRFFGMAHFGAILGASGLFSSLGQVVGPYLTGWLYDATGGYDAALMMFIGAYGLAGLSFMALGVMTRRK